VGVGVSAGAGVGAVDSRKDASSGAVVSNVGWDSACRMIASSREDAHHVQIRVVEARHSQAAQLSGECGHGDAEEGGVAVAAPRRGSRAKGR